MPDDQIQAIFNRPRPSADVSFGTNVPVLPAGQSRTTTTSPTPRAATTTWQGFVPGERHRMSSHDIFSSERDGALTGNATGKSGVDMDALRFQLAIYQSVASHPQCAVLADLLDEAGRTGKLDLNGISPAAVDQLSNQVWQALRGFVAELQLPSDTSHDTELRWRTALALPGPATPNSRVKKRSLSEETGTAGDVQPGRKRRAVGGLVSGGERPVRRTDASVVSTSAHPSASSFQLPMTPAAYEARNLKVLELLCANPGISTKDLAAVLNASAASWSAVNAEVIRPLRRYFEAMRAVSQGAAPLNTASHVYAICKDNAELTTDAVYQQVALRVAPKVVGMRNLVGMLSLMRTAIDNGLLPGTALRPSAAAAATESADRDLEILRMCAESPSISSKWVADRLGESTPKQLNSLRTALTFVRILHVAHRAAPGEALGPLERIYVRLRDDKTQRADDPGRIKLLEEIWKQSGRPPSDFRRFRSLCVLAIENKVFDGADGGRDEPIGQTP